MATEIMAVRFVQVRQSRTDKESTMECNQGHPGGVLMGTLPALMLSGALCIAPCVHPMPCPDALGRSLYGPVYPYHLLPCTAALPAATGPHALCIWCRHCMPCACPHAFGCPLCGPVYSSDALRCTGTLPVAAEMLSDDLCLTRTSNLPPALMQSDVLHVA